MLKKLLRYSVIFTALVLAFLAFNNFDKRAQCYKLQDLQYKNPEIIYSKAQAEVCENELIYLNTKIK